MNGNTIFCCKNGIAYAGEVGVFCPRNQNNEPLADGWYFCKEGWQEYSGPYTLEADCRVELFSYFARL